MTGTGTMASGEIPAPFGSLLQLNELQELKTRFKIVFVAFIIGAIYSSFLFMLLEFTFVDIAIVLGTAFLGYRTLKLSDKIYEMEQYLHGEGVLALE